jgi:hypothetical protein
VFSMAYASDKTQLVASVPRTMLAQLHEAARADGVSMAEVLRRAVRAWLESDRTREEADPPAKESASETNAPTADAPGRLHRTGA